MSATDEEAAEFLRAGSGIVCEVAGGVAGAALGMIVAGPPGAVFGAALAPFVEHQLKRVAGEFVNRRMGERQQQRAGAGALLLASSIQRELAEGRPLRSDDFGTPDRTGRRPADELAEQAVTSMIASIDERRLPYLADFYADLYFDPTIPRSSLPALVQIVDGLSYRAMCMLSIVGAGTLYTGTSDDEPKEGGWSSNDHVVAREAFSLLSGGLLIERKIGSESFEAVFGYVEVEPQLLLLGSVGRIVFDKMRLSAMPQEDPALQETAEALRCIRAASGGLLGPVFSLDGETF